MNVSSFFITYCMSEFQSRDLCTASGSRCPSWENRMGGFRKGGFSNNRFVLKPDVAIASEVSILSKNSMAATDFRAKKTQRVHLFENPLPHAHAGLHLLMLILRTGPPSALFLGFANNASASGSAVCCLE